MIKRRTKAGSQGYRKGPVNVYAIASETAANVIRRHSVKMAIRQQNRGVESGHSWPESRRIAGDRESTRISERDMPYESASPVVASPSPVGAAEPENGHWRNGGRKTSATVASTVVHDDKIVTTPARSLRGSETSHRGGAGVFRQGIHPSDHLNQASAPPTSDSSALSVERILQSAASARARPGAKPAHAHTHDTRTRETPLALEECGYACHGGCIAPLRHQRNAITGALGSGDEQWIRGEKSPPRGDTPDNGKDRAKWAK